MNTKINVITNTISYLHKGFRVVVALYNQKVIKLRIDKLIQVNL
jgi:hypothetical protein